MMTLLEGILVYLGVGFILAVCTGVWLRKPGKGLPYAAQYAAVVAFGPVVWALLLSLSVWTFICFPFGWAAKKLVDLTTQKPVVHVERPIQLVREDDEQWRNPN